MVIEQAGADAALWIASGLAYLWSDHVGTGDPAVQWSESVPLDFGVSQIDTNARNEAAGVKARAGKIAGFLLLCAAAVGGISLVSPIAGVVYFVFVAASVGLAVDIVWLQRTVSFIYANSLDTQFYIRHKHSTDDEREALFAQQYPGPARRLRSYKAKHRHAATEYEPILVDPKTF